MTTPSKTDQRMRSRERYRSYGNYASMLSCDGNPAIHCRVIDSRDGGRGMGPALVPSPCQEPRYYIVKVTSRYLCSDSGLFFPVPSRIMSSWQGGGVAVHRPSSQGICDESRISD